jgi:RND family efflux transporter MFP subunit
MKLLNKWLLLASVVTLPMLFSNCQSHNHHTKKGHVHDAHLLLTGYGEQYEIFVEADPFVINTSSNLLAHFSQLSNFRPLTKGEITATLNIGGKKVKQTVKVPSRPGIYRFQLTPNQSGKGTLTFTIVDAKGKSITTLSPIQVYKDEHTAHHKAEDQEPHTVNSVSFTKEKSWKVDFATAVINATPFKEVIKTVAQIEASTTGEKTIVAQSSGIVKFIKNTTEGQAVKKGEVICILQGEGLTNENQNVRFQQIKAEYKEAQKRLQRKKTLSEEGIISKADYEATLRDYKMTKATYDNMRNHFTMQGQHVRIPMQGYLKEITVKNGTYVSAGTPLFTVAQNKYVYLKAWLSPRYYTALQQFSGANIYLPQEQKSYALENLDGKLVSFSKSTSTEQPLLAVTLQIANNKQWIPGRFVDLYLKAQSKENSIAVPRTAIVEEMGNTFVFVQVTPELFEKRLVQCATTDGINTLLLKGLKSGERIVTQGATLVKLSQAAGALDPHAGHVH